MQWSSGASGPALRTSAAGICCAIGAALAAPAFADGLTGDWGGARTSLAEHGVTLNLQSTHYYQGLVSGSGSDDWEYGGRIDALLDFDTGKLGLWQGGVIRTHTEYRYGDLPANHGATLVGTNTGRLLPTGEDEELVVTSIHLAQQLGDRAMLMIGRINALDLIAAEPFFGGGGQTRFLNVAFSAPPSGVTPPVIMGAVLSVRAAPVSWTFMLFDPDDQTDDYWPDDFFGSGTTATVSSSYRGLWAGRTSTANLTATYTTKDGANLGELLLPPELQTGARDHSWFLGLQLGHFLRESAAGRGDGWGVFLKLGTSDGNPNPFQASFMAGVGGKGLFPSRPDDAFGLGYFYVDFSDDLQSVLDPLVGFQDEQGIEAFYRYAVTDWLDVTADVQFVDPALTAADDGVVAGVRLNLRF